MAETGRSFGGEEDLQQRSVLCVSLLVCGAGLEERASGNAVRMRRWLETLSEFDEALDVQIEDWVDDQVEQGPVDSEGR